MDVGGGYVTVATFNSTKRQRGKEVDKNNRTEGREGNKANKINQHLNNEG